jgi:Rieske Fe-S protein
MDLNNGEGKIIDYKNQKVGAYKDNNGQTFAVQPNCTYEGCMVDWESNEKIYICPCCGSRYSFDGKVIKGPATKELPKIKTTTL